MNLLHLDSICRLLRWHTTANPLPLLGLNTIRLAVSVYQPLRISGQRVAVYCTNTTLTPGSEADRVLQPDNHCFPCDLSSVCLFSPRRCYVKEDFHTGLFFHIVCLLVLCVLVSSGASVHWLCRVLWQVHRPLWDRMHGWLTSIWPICHPQRGGGECVCVLSYHSMGPSHNIRVLIFHMTLGGAGMDTCVLLCVENVVYLH